MSKTLKVPSPEPKLEVLPTSIAQTISHGEFVTETITISNTGEAELTDVAISISGDIANWVSFSQNYFPSISAGQSTSVTLTISVPEGATEGTYSGTIWVSPANAESMNVDVTISLTATPPSEPARADFKIRDRLLPEKVFGAGDDIPITVQIKNEGADGVAFVTLDIFGPKEYNRLRHHFSLPSQEISIPQGDSANLDFMWTVPSDAPAGIYYVSINVWDKSSGELNDQKLFEGPAFMIDKEVSYIQIEEWFRGPEWLGKHRAVYIHIAKNDIEVSNIRNFEGLLIAIKAASISSSIPELIKGAITAYGAWKQAIKINQEGSYDIQFF